MAKNMKIAVCINLLLECVAQSVKGGIKGLLLGQPVYNSRKLLHRSARCALEAALTLREVFSGSSITSVAIGPPAAGWAMRYCLALGVNQAVHLTSKATTGVDILNPLTASLILSQYLEGKGFDLIVCGAADAGYDNTPLGPLLAEHLDLPFISEVVNIDEINTDDGFITLTRFLNRGNRIKLKTTLPAVLGVNSFFKEPRYIALRSLKKTNVQQVESIPVAVSTGGGSSNKEPLPLTPLRIRAKVVAVPPPGASYRERLDFIITGGDMGEKKVNLLEGDVSYIAGKILEYLIAENIIKANIPAEQDTNDEDIS